MTSEISELGVDVRYQGRRTHIDIDQNSRLLK